MLPFVGALLAGVAGQAAMQVACCCVPLLVLPLGALPAGLAWRNDQTLTPSQGFAVSFIGVGLGAVLAAGIAVMSMGELDQTEVRGQLRNLIEQANETATEDQRMTQAEIDAEVARQAEALPFAPVVLAGIGTIIGGLVGMATIAMLRRSRPPPPIAPPAETGS
ncbi:MAG: hypothetical protein AAF628_03465 [Planctomycetota bacterium]